jgi:hypothetical protein
MADDFEPLDDFESAPTSGMSAGERAIRSLGGGAMHGLRQAGNLLSKAVSSGDSELISDKDVEASRAALNKLTEGHPWSGGLPSVVGQALPAVGAATLAAPMLPGGLAGAALSGIAQGGVFSDPGDRTTGMVTGGIAGPALHGLGRTLSKITSGITPKGAGAELVDRGFKPEMTAGELNPGGFLHRLEHATANIPLAGPTVHKAYEKSLGIMPKALEDALSPSATAPALPSVAEAGGTQQWFKAAADRISDSYNAIKSSAGPMPIRPQFITQGARDAIINTPGMTMKAEKNVSQIIQNTMLPILKKGNASTFEDVQTTRTFLRDAIRKWGSSEEAESGVIADALRKFEGHLTGAMSNALPPEGAAALKGADLAWSNLNLVKEGLARQASQSGSPLANQSAIQPRPLAQAMSSRIGDWNVVKGGGGDLRKFLEAADTALTPPPSAEAARAIQAAGGGPFALAALRPRALGVVGGLSGFYTPVGQRILKGESLPQKALFHALDAMPEGADPALRAALIELLRQKESR